MAAYDSKITIIEQRVVEGNKVYIEGMMEDGAVKPTENIAGGSNLYDFDNQIAYFFKASTGAWIAQGGDSNA